MPNRFAAYSMYATTFDWLTATPFGIPVLPEVNSKYAVAFPSTTGSTGSATFANRLAERTRCDFTNAAFGSHPASGRIKVNGFSIRGSNDSSTLAHSSPTIIVLHPDAFSMVSVRSKGNFGFSGQYPRPLPRIPRMPP